jgi:uncharacterized protein
MESLSPALPFLKVFAAFAVILVGMKNRLGLAQSIFVGGWFLGLVFGLSLAECLVTSGEALLHGRFHLLLAIVAAILVLSDALERTGQSTRLMASLAGYLVGPRLRLVFFPALIGLLPMPGGAVFSAPMVKAVSNGMTLSQEDRAVINYWFRHVWEMGWPLYPGIILTVALAGVPITAFLTYSWPGVAAMFAIGWFFFLRPGILDPGTGGARGEAAGGNCPRRVVREGLPLLIAIVGAIAMETLLSHFAPGIPFEWGVIVALVAAIACIAVQNRLGTSYLRQILKKRSLWGMLLVIAAIFIFKDLMQAAGVVTAISAAAGSGVALFAAAVFLPFLVGAVAGINVAFVGATFPLLLGLLESLAMEEQTIPYLVLAYFSGCTGVLVSPIHICFVLTCDYFGTDLFRSWRRIVLPCLSFGAFGGALSWFFLR